MRPCLKRRPNHNTMETNFWACLWGIFSIRLNQVERPLPPLWWEQHRSGVSTPYVSSSIPRLPPHMRAAASCGSHPIWEQHHSKSCISERMKRRKGQHQYCFPNVDAVWPAASSSIHHDFPTDIKSCIPRGTVSQSDLFSSLSCFFHGVRKVATTNASR